MTVSARAAQGGPRSSKVPPYRADCARPGAPSLESSTHMQSTSSPPAVAEVLASRTPRTFPSERAPEWQGAALTLL